MTPHHAIEIILTRPITPDELRHVGRGVPVAANADRTRLMAVHGGRNPSHVLHTLQRRLGTRLPIDVLTTHYPNGHGQVLLNVGPTRSCARPRPQRDSGPRMCCADA